MSAPPIRHRGRARRSNALEDHHVDVTWYRDFFEGIVLEMWRKAVSPEQTRAEVDFLEQELKMKPGARVLDVPCGGGRHAVEMATRGYQVTGVDLSPGMLEEVRQRAAEAGVKVDWHLADMRQLPWPSAFDAAYCFGNSFGYLEPEGTRDFVAALSRALKQGARFALDTGGAAECILPNLRQREEAQIDDIQFIEENVYHPLESCLETTYTFKRAGQSVTRTGLQWVYTLREIRDLFAKAVLRAEGFYGSLEREPFKVGSRYLIITGSRG
jgi:cyclopropane fatty-acyl-phospholipid synthase-like methyltransferase